MGGLSWQAAGGGAWLGYGRQLLYAGGRFWWLLRVVKSVDQLRLHSRSWQPPDAQLLSELADGKLRKIHYFYLKIEKKKS